MDLKFADFCIKFYGGKLDEEDSRRLTFFRNLWDARERAFEAVQGEVDAYDMPGTDVLKAVYKAGQPVFRLTWPDVPKESFAAVASSIAGFLAREGTFDEDVMKEVFGLDWNDVLSYEPPRLAAADVEAWLDKFADGIAAAGASEQAAHMAALVASLALRSFYEGPAASVMEAIGMDEDVISAHPLRCPVCGCSPTVASVGGETSSAGRGRRLFCQQCGTAWEFDRVRCARCGTRDQTKLHFFNIEGDDEHRIATCDECGNYMRVTYIDDKLHPICFDVEDVVMGRLDALAQDPRFLKGETDA